MGRQPKRSNKAPKRNAAARQPAVTLRRQDRVATPPPSPTPPEPVESIIETLKIHPQHQQEQVISLSEAGNLGNYEVWRSEAEKTINLNEVCSHLNVTTEALFNFARSTAAVLIPNEANPLEDKPALAEEVPIKSNRSDVVQQQPEERHFATEKTLSNGCNNSDLKMNQTAEKRLSEILPPNHDRQELAETLYSNGIDQMQDQTNAFALNSFSFEETRYDGVAVMRSDIGVGPMQSDKAENLNTQKESHPTMVVERSATFWSIGEKYPFPVRMIITLPHACFSTLISPIVSLPASLLRLIKNVLLYVYDLV